MKKLLPFVCTIFCVTGFFLICWSGVWHINAIHKFGSYDEMTNFYRLGEDECQKLSGMSAEECEEIVFYNNFYANSIMPKKSNLNIALIVGFFLLTIGGIIELLLPKEEVLS